MKTRKWKELNLPEEATEELMVLATTLAQCIQPYKKGQLVRGSLLERGVQELRMALLEAESVGFLAAMDRLEEKSLREAKRDAYYRNL